MGEAKRVFLAPRLIVADDDPTQVVDKSKIAKRENVGGSNKACYFKAADQLTENPNICFGMDVSPDCRDYALQALLHQMDNKIYMGHEIEASVQQETGNKIDKVLTEKDQSLHETKTIFLINKKNPKKHSVGRMVFLVTVGQMKHFQISLKPVKETLKLLVNSGSHRI
jgi:hypothetical protein